LGGSGADAVGVVFVRPMSLTTYGGTPLELEVRRRVRLLGASEVADWVEGEPSLEGVGWVAFETDNTITNVGEEAWRAESGRPSIWILAMFNPSPDTWVVLPYQTGADGPVVNDEYFGKVPPQRLVDEEGWLFFAADGKHRSKIGLPAGRAGAFAGSYAPSSRLLTIVTYDAPESGSPAGYVNSMWGEQDDPYAGDVINAYNDGPVAPGQPTLGGFYEIETSSPAAALAPGASLTHTHRTLHLLGSADQLHPWALAAFGLPLARITRHPLK